jgi:hypothetical protein
LREKLDFVRCLVSFYAILDIGPAAKSQSLDPEKEGSAGFSPITYLRKEGPRLPPMFIGRAGRDAPYINEAVDRFIARALELDETIEVMNHPGGRHGFDILDDDARSREIIARAKERIALRSVISSGGRLGAYFEVRGGGREGDASFGLYFEGDQVTGFSVKHIEPTSAVLVIAGEDVTFSL